MPNKKVFYILGALVIAGATAFAFVGKQGDSLQGRFSIDNLSGGKNIVAGGQKSEVIAPPSAPIVDASPNVQVAPPKVEITYPKPGEKVSGNTLAVNLLIKSSLDVNKVEVYMDSKLVKTTDFEKPVPNFYYTPIINIGNKPQDKPIALKVKVYSNKVYNEFGTFGEDDVTFTIHEEPLQFKIISPKKGDVVKADKKPQVNGKQQLNFDFKLDTVGVKSVNVLVGDGSSPYSQIVPPAYGSGSFSPDGKTYTWKSLIYEWNKKTKNWHINFPDNTKLRPLECPYDNGVDGTADPCPRFITIQAFKSGTEMVEKKIKITVHNDYTHYSDQQSQSIYYTVDSVE